MGTRAPVRLCFQTGDGFSPGRNCSGALAGRRAELRGPRGGGHGQPHARSAPGGIQPQSDQQPSSHRRGPRRGEPGTGLRGLPQPGGARFRHPGGGCVPGREHATLRGPKRHLRAGLPQLLRRPGLDLERSGAVGRPRARQRGQALVAHCQRRVGRNGGGDVLPEPGSRADAGPGGHRVQPRRSGRRPAGGHGGLPGGYLLGALRGRRCHLQSPGEGQRGKHQLVRGGSNIIPNMGDYIFSVSRGN